MYSYNVLSHPSITQHFHTMIVIFPASICPPILKYNIHVSNGFHCNRSVLILLVFSKCVFKFVLSFLSNIYSSSLTTIFGYILGDIWEKAIDVIRLLIKDCEEETFDYSNLADLLVR